MKNFPQANTVTKSKRHRRFRFRATVSFTLVFAFLLMAVSGIVLYLAPKCRDARLLDWQYLRWDRQEWVDVHITSCVLFLVLGGMHVFYNWRVLRGYLYSKARRDMNHWKELLVAMALTGVVLVGTLRGWPPMNRLLLWRQEWKHRYSAPGPRFLRGRVEEAPLADLAWQIGVSPDELFESLRKEGYNVDDAERPLGALAADNSVSSVELFASLVKHHPELGQSPGQGGFGRRGQGAGSRRRRNRPRPGDSATDRR